MPWCFGFFPGQEEFYLVRQHFQLIGNKRVGPSEPQDPYSTVCAAQTRLKLMRDTFFRNNSAMFHSLYRCPIFNIFIVDLVKVNQVNS